MKPEQLELSAQPSGYYDSDRSEMLRYVPASARRTLEFGCGTGRFSQLLRQTRCTESWGVEIHTEAAAEAGTKLDKVITCDAAAALNEIPDGYFDCILFFDVLEHLIDPYSVLASVKTKLAENGVMVASIPNVRYYRVLVDLVVHGNWDYRGHGVLDRTHLRFFTRKSIVKMCKKLTFEVITLEGMHPTSSRTFKVVNVLAFNRLADCRYKHYALVAAPLSSI